MACKSRGKCEKIDVLRKNVTSYVKTMHAVHATFTSLGGTFENHAAWSRVNGGTHKNVRLAGPIG